MINGRLLNAAMMTWRKNMWLVSLRLARHPTKVTPDAGWDWRFLSCMAYST